MKNQDSYRRGRHCVSDLKAHLVFVTKYRRDVLTGIHLERMRHIFNEVCYNLEARLIEFNGEDDHVQILVEYPPKLAISTLVNSLKGVSSRKLRAEFFIKTYKEHLWSPSYFVVSCGGAPIEKLKEYIKQQQTPPTSA